MQRPTFSHSIDLDRAVDERPLKDVFFAPFSSGQRHRRGGDGIRVGMGLLGLIGLAVAARAGASLQAQVTGAVLPLPFGMAWLLSSLWFLSTAGAIIAVGVAAAMARTTALLRDGVVAVAFGILGAMAYRALLGPATPGANNSGYDGVKNQSIVLLLTTAAAIQLAVAPYLSRSLRRTVRLVITLGAVVGVFYGAGATTAVLTSVVLGWTAVSAMHLLVGSPEGLPSLEDVASLFAGIGASVEGLERQPSRGWGAVRYWGTLDGVAIEAVVVGRDATEAQLLSKLGRSLFFRDSGPSLATTSLQQVEHEAFATMMASRVLEDRAPVVITAGEVGGNAVLLLERPEGRRLDALAPDDVPSGTAKAIIETVSALSGSMAHGAIAGSTILVDETAKVSLVGFERSTATPSDERRYRDLAAALVCAALAGTTDVGVDQAVAAAIEVVGADELVSALPFLQRAALPAGLSPM
ncbi:MAG: hypothetical protein WCL38_06840, partial [Actinomycetota bacterium]